MPGQLQIRVFPQPLPAVWGLPRTGSAVCYYYWFGMKDTAQELPSGGDAQDRLGGRAQSLSALCACGTRLAQQGFTDPEDPKPRSGLYQGFMMSS